MLDLNDFIYFVQIVDRGGFTAASKALGIPKSTLSHRMQALEVALGARLLNRNSRRFSMTQVGQEFYANASLLAEQAEIAEVSVRRQTGELRGPIRLTTPATVAHFALKDLLPEFLLRFPEVDIVHLATNLSVDLVAENYDVAIRAHSGPLPASNLVQRPLAGVPWIFMASPSYLKKMGNPEAPEDLKKHHSLFMAKGSERPAWQLKGAHNHISVVPIAPRFKSNDLHALKELACAGTGVVALPAYTCRSELETGQLVRVLPNFLADETSLTALLPARRGLLPSVRAFIDYLVVELPKAVRVPL